MKVNNYNVVPPNVNCTVFGTDENGSQKNFNVQALLALNATPEVVATNLLTSRTILVTNTYFTGTAGASFAITLPASNSNLNGAKYVVMATETRAATTWISSGATIVGAPSTLTANTPVCLQYNHANATWYISL
jgi:hypothetical protein